MNTDTIERDVTEVIRGASQELVRARNHSDGSRTKTIFAALTKYAYSQKLKVWSKPNDVDRTINECMFDLEIFEGKTPTDTDRVWVALESEWSPKFEEIRYDFYKLVKCRSELRVMIFQSRNLRKVTDDLIEILESNEMSVSGDRYLFAGWNNIGGFSFRAHTKC